MPYCSGERTVPTIGVLGDKIYVMKISFFLLSYFIHVLQKSCGRNKSYKYFNSWQKDILT